MLVEAVTFIETFVKQTNIIDQVNFGDELSYCDPKLKIHNTYKFSKLAKLHSDNVLMVENVSCLQESKLNKKAAL